MKANDILHIFAPLRDYHELDMWCQRKEIQGEIRDRHIYDCSMSYLQDPGTFFEFIQSIEIGEEDSGLFEDIHQDLLAEDGCNVGEQINNLYKAYCDRLATISVDDGSYP